MVFRIAGEQVTLRDFDVNTEPLSADEADNYLDCNVGQSLLDQFGEFVINFRSMSLLLRNRREG